MVARRSLSKSLLIKYECFMSSLSVMSMTQSMFYGVTVNDVTDSMNVLWGHYQWCNWRNECFKGSLQSVDGPRDLHQWVRIDLQQFSHNDEPKIEQCSHPLLHPHKYSSKVYGCQSVSCLQHCFFTIICCFHVMSVVVTKIIVMLRCWDLLAK